MFITKNKPGADRVPSDALLHQTGPVCMPAAPDRCPGGTCAACCRAPCDFKFQISTGHRSGSVGYVTMDAVEMKFGRAPHGLEILRQAAGFGNRTGPGVFMKAPLSIR